MKRPQIIRKHLQGWPIVALALSVPLWGCPPNLTGEACLSDCNCPTDQSCVFAAGAASGTCQNGTNLCSTLGDGGSQPDAGDAGDAGDGGTTADAGDAGGSNNAFQGVLVLNGLAVPPNTAKIYAFADGVPVTNAAGVYSSADVTELTNNRGVFAFPNPVPAPSDTGYRFVGVYDTKGRGDYSITDPGIFWQFSAGNLAPGSSASEAMRIDVQTSVCLSITTDLGQANSGAGETFFLGVGTSAVDVHTGAPLILQTDLDAVAATFDAGSALPPGGGFSGSLSFEPISTIPILDLSGWWFYPNASTKAAVGPLSNTGTFFVTLSDGSHAQPQYPSGNCDVTYRPPPGFPGNLAVNGVDAGLLGAPVLWQSNISSGGPGTRGDQVSWSDFSGTLPDGVVFLGDYLAILGPLPDGGTQQIYPDGGQIILQPSPMTIQPSAVPPNLCDEGSKSTCALEITTFYVEGHGTRGVAIEGGTTLLPIQRANSGGPGN